MRIRALVAAIGIVGVALAVVLWRAGLGSQDPERLTDAAALPHAPKPRPEVGEETLRTGEAAREERATEARVPGGVVRGRVVDGHGRGVGGVRVRMHRASGETVYNTGVTDTGGAYGLDIEEAGRFRLVVREATRGLAVSTTLELSPQRDTEAPDLVLVEGGVLAGKAVCPDGSPVADLEVWAKWVAPLPPEAVAVPLPDGWDAALETDSSSIVRSDRGGRFGFKGLRPGIHELSHSLGIGFDRKEKQYATGTRDAELLVEGYRLRFRVQDEDGKALGGTHLSVSGWRPDVAAEAARRFGLGEFLEEAGFWVAGATDGPFAEMQLLVEPGTFCIAKIRLPGQRRGVAGVRAGDGSTGWETIVPVIVRPLGPTGRIRVDVEDEEGKPIRTFAASLQGPTDDSPGVSGLDRDAKERDGLLRPAVPGRYRLFVRPGKGLFGMTDYFEETREVLVRANITDVVKIRARRGGRVRVTVRLPRGMELERLKDCRIRARTAAGNVTPKLGPYVYRTETGWRSHWRVHPGRPFTCRRLLAPGVHTLTIEAQGFSRWERIVEVEAGAVSEVEATLR